MVFTYGFCNGNARAAAVEYRRRYPDRRHPDFRVFYRVYQHLREKGSFPGIQRTAERIGAEQKGTVQMAIRSPCISTRTLSSRPGVPRMTAWRALKKGLHPYHLQTTQHLKPEDYERRLNFCHWLQEHPHHCSNILYTDEAIFTRQGANNSHNEHCCCCPGVSIAESIGEYHV